MNNFKLAHRHTKLAILRREWLGSYKVIFTYFLREIAAGNIKPVNAATRFYEVVSYGFGNTYQVTSIDQLWDVLKGDKKINLTDKVKANIVKNDGYNFWERRQYVGGVNNVTKINKIKHYQDSLDLVIRKHEKLASDKLLKGVKLGREQTADSTVRSAKIIIESLNHEKRVETLKARKQNLIAA